MNIGVYCKTMEIFRNKIDIRLVNKEKEYLKWMSNRSYMSQKYLTMF